jgi:5-methylcytosine-specific restriction endonuclease McrA
MESPQFNKVAVAVLETPHGLATERDLLMQPDHTSNAPAFKTCSKCKQSKPATTEYFGRYRKSPSGLAYQCKECTRADGREWRAKNPNCMRQWNAAHPDYMRRYYKGIAEDRRDSYRQRSRQRYAENEEHRKRRSEYLRQWQLANREAKISQVRNYKARKRNASGVHTATDIQRLIRIQKGECYYCGCTVGDTYHVDHVVPLSRGGSNGPENLVIACKACNLSKGNKLIHEWREEA